MDLSETGTTVTIISGLAILGIGFAWRRLSEFARHERTQ